MDKSTILRCFLAGSILAIILVCAWAQAEVKYEYYEGPGVVRQIVPDEVLFTSKPTQNKVLYVDDDAAGANDGSSWEDAFVDLQDALAAVTYGDEIRVGEGVYRPAPLGGDRMATFQLVAGVAMRGGFAGTGAEDPDTRNVSRFKSVLSGDLNGDDEMGGNVSEDNSRHVLTGSGTPSNTVLEGFVISDGVGAYNGAYGGGLYNVAGSPTVLRCVFTKIRGLRGYSGNAICGNGGSFPLIIDCVFAGCRWALFFDYSDADIRNCLFFDNEQNIELDGGAQPVFTDCIDGVDPMFVDRWHGDYHLQAGSPCIDAGDNTVIEPDWVDLDGNERILNGTADIGIFEAAVTTVIEADVRIVPRVINRNNRRARILARVRLPENVAIELIDRNEALVLLDGEIKAQRQHVFDVGKPGQRVVYVFAFFRAEKLLQAVGKNGDVELDVSGKLKDGRIFYGADVVRIIGKELTDRDQSRKTVRRGKARTKSARSQPNRR